MLLHQDGPDYFSAQKVWDFKKLNYASTAFEVWGSTCSQNINISVARHE